MEEYKKEMLMISAILFKNNVPVEEAKPIGAFIEKLIEENNQLKEKLELSEKARKESMLILGEYRHYTLPTEEQNIENEEYCYLAQNPNERCRKDVFEEALSKYKEIIGVKDE